MYLREVFITNFRCFNEFKTNLEEFSTIIGRNNVGKTSFINALEYLFHPGSDRAVPLSKDDFREPSKEIVIQATFDNLCPVDTQAFFSLDGTPGVKEVGVRLEAKWDDGELCCDRFLIRPDKETIEEQKVRRFSQRFSQFISFSHIPAFRYPEQSTRFTRGSDYRTLVTTYAGDFIQPIQALANDIRNTNKQFQDEFSDRGEISVEENVSFHKVLNDFLDLLPPENGISSANEFSKEYGANIDKAWNAWTCTLDTFQGFLNKMVKDDGNSITDELIETCQKIGTKVEKLYNRLKIRLALLELRDSVIDNQDFKLLQLSLNEVFSLILPEVSPEILPFPAQDDLLFSEVLVKLGNYDLLHTGSGFQSTFAIGLRIARIISDLNKGIHPRILILAIEEPEAHLHPHKQRHFMTALQDFREKMKDKGLVIQFIVTTHSSNIFSGLSQEKLVVFRSERGFTKSIKLEKDDFYEEWLNELNILGSDKRTRAKKVLKRWIRRYFEQYAESLFARFVLILEGESEFGAIPEWFKHLPKPNDINQLGISLIPAGGTDFKYVSYLMKQFQIDYLGIYDKEDGHDLSGLDKNRLFPTDCSKFEDEIMSVLPMSKVLRAVETSLSDKESDGVLKYITRTGNRLGLPSDVGWDEIIDSVDERVQTIPGFLEEIKAVLMDNVLSNKRKIFKGADVGSLLASSASLPAEIPNVYFAAIKLARKSALEVMENEYHS